MFGFWGFGAFMQGFINEMVYGSRWEAIWVQSSLALNVSHIGRLLCSSIETGINLRSWPYADRDKDLVSVHMDLCSESQVYCLCVCVFRMSPRQGWTPTLDASCGMP